MSLEEKAFQIGCMFDARHQYKMIESYELLSLHKYDENHLHDRYHMRNIL